MNPEESQKPKTEAQEAGKKAYHKPSIQVYGTLADLTGATKNNMGVSDGGGSAPSTAT